MTPMNETYLQNLEERENFFARTPFRKLIGSPGKMAKSLLIERVLQATSRTHPFTAETFWGDQMTVLLPEAVSVSIHRYGFFESDLSRMVVGYLKPGMVFFDVGAHFGYYTLLASRLVGPQGQVHAFEPTPSTRSVLKRNADDKANVSLCAEAAWDKEGVLQLQDYGTRYLAFNTLGASRLPNNIRRKIDVKEISVSTVTLDNYAKTSGVVPDLVKIDAENSELQVLAGMKALLETRKTAIAVEMGDFNDSADASSRKLSIFLRKPAISHTR
ncbi:MAG: FkbM family methyltransferase [Myxococcales bacterium]|nr:MAG: FkbM family methyltransferase [Myxococcales bacterium]